MAIVGSLGFDIDALAQDCALMHRTDKHPYLIGADGLEALLLDGVEQSRQHSVRRLSDDPAADEP